MNSLWASAGLVTGFVLLCAALLAWSQRRWPAETSALINTLDAALPQIQCAQCGYPGCRPYAEAIALGSAGVDLCPPGGPDTQAALASIMGTGVQAPLPVAALASVVIDESACIGCALCLPACPVDAIIGAKGYMHSVIDNECTGCELCIPACPVDCIQLLPMATS